MKKYLYAITAAAVMLAAFTSCGQEKADSSSQVSEPEESVSATEEATEEAAEAETTTETVTEEITEVPTEAVTEAAAEAPTEEPTEAVEASDYRTAYLELINTVEDSDTLTYDLIYLDEDDIPELVTGNGGFFISIYTYIDNQLYNLADHWSYGAFGINGYYYVPGKNHIRVSDSDWAGMARTTAYLRMFHNDATNSYEIENYTAYTAYHFDDANDNDMPDEDEDYQETPVVYYNMNGEEIDAETALANDYNTDEYEFIFPEMTLDEIKAALS